MKNESISNRNSLTSFESESLLNNQDADLDFLDQIPVKEWASPLPSSTEDSFVSSNAASDWVSTQPVISDTERAIELSENYLESIHTTLQMMSRGQVDHAPAVLEVREQLERIQQELSRVSFQHLDTPQRSQLQAIRHALTQTRLQLARTERLDLPRSIIPSDLLNTPQMPRAFQRIAQLRNQCANCHSSSEAWHLIEQLRQLETQTRNLVPQIIWQHGQETEIFNVSSLQDEIRNLRLELIGNIRRGSFQARIQ